jgi:glycosyltransferase involved in cell wall biosynthesis
MGFIMRRRIVVAAAHVERTLISAYGCDPKRVSTILIGANVDIVPVSTDRTRYAGKQVLFVGVEWERKGGPALVEGFREAAKDHPTAHLTIVGCSPVGTGPNITVAGSVARSSMPRHYETASVFCMPSLVEPLGIAVVEASQFRLPVIATPIGGFPETVTDGETGFLVPPNDPCAIAGALRRLFEDPDRARRRGEAGFERNRLRFDRNEVGRRLRITTQTIIPGYEAVSSPPFP